MRPAALTGQRRASWPGIPPGRRQRAGGSAWSGSRRLDPAISAREHGHGTQRGNETQQRGRWPVPAVRTSPGVGGDRSLPGVTGPRPGHGLLPG